MIFQFFIGIFIIVLLIRDKWKSVKYMQLHKKIGISSMSFPFIGHGLIFYGDGEAISDPESAHFVLKTCLDKGSMTLVFRHMVGNGSIFAQEKIWRIRRKINAMVLAPRHVNKFTKVFSRNSQVLVEKLAKAAGKGNISVWEYLCHHVIQSACETTLGETVNLRPEQFQPFCEAFMSYFDNVIKRLCQPWLYNITLYKLLPEASRQSAKKKIVWSFINNLIIRNKVMLKAKRDGLTENNNFSPSDDTKSLLELLIDYSKGYSDTELREESLVLLLASIDTSVSVSGFALVLLSQHQDVQDKVYEEIQQVFENSIRPICMDDINKFKYLDAVIKETMRVYPTTPLIMRKCQKDIKLPSGLILKEGTQLVVNIYGLHRNPKYWGPDADKFKPERFLNATPEQLTAYMPFSSGPRNCAGYRIGAISLKVVIISVLQKFRLKPSSSFTYNEQNPLRMIHTLVTKHGDRFQLQLEHR
ncbi:unnamed protein product [Euphydryas editha]|uniref:Cytochrome P450 n=1 Tax=Euphydryas editha TaxID=104508 RepID=A0AAU9V0Y1_EUPED|nr:unnamed protein product [Euphydryas editha]